MLEKYNYYYILRCDDDIDDLIFKDEEWFSSER